MTQADHNIAANDGNLMGLDQEVHIKFVNKTDSGLTITAMNELSTHDGNGDDTYVSIAGGFGSLKLGNTDAASSSFDMNPLDLVQEEAAGTLHDGTDLATPSRQAATIETRYWYRRC